MLVYLNHFSCTDRPVGLLEHCWAENPHFAMAAERLYAAKSGGYVTRKPFRELIIHITRLIVTRSQKDDHMI